MIINWPRFDLVVERICFSHSPFEASVRKKWRAQTTTIFIRRRFNTQCDDDDDAVACNIKQNDLYQWPVELLLVLQCKVSQYCWWFWYFQPIKINVNRPTGFHARNYRENKLNIFEMVDFDLAVAVCVFDIMLRYFKRKYSMKMSSNGSRFVVNNPNDITIHLVSLEVKKCSPSDSFIIVLFVCEFQSSWVCICAPITFD